MSKQKSNRKPKPRPYQRKAITAVIKGFKTNDRGKLIMACGSGKTLTALWIKEKMKSGRVLLVAPSISLISQTLDEWKKHWREPSRVVVVCSDKTTVNEQALTKEMGEKRHVTVTTDPEVIAKVLRSKEKNLIVLSTYQSCPKVAEAQKKSRGWFDLAIVDEAHRCVGTAGRKFSTVVDSKQVRARKRLFMTATPKYFTKAVTKKAKQKELTLVDMGDEKLFGPVFANYSFKDAIDQGHLCDYRIVVHVVDSKDILKLARKKTRVKTNVHLSVVDSTLVAAQVALLKNVAAYELKSAITFHNRVRKAYDFAESLKATSWMMNKSERVYRDIRCSTIDGKTKAVDRREILSRLKDRNEDLCVVSNAHCLTEGVDVPSLDAVMFVDPKNSEVEITQASGRVLRPAKGKDKGTIIIPVYVEDKSRIVEDLKSGAFSPVWKLLRAMQAQDGELAKRLDKLGRGSDDEKREVREEIFEKVEFNVDFSTTLGKEFAEAISVAIVKNTQDRWNHNFRLLEEYVEEHGNVDVPQRDKWKGAKLGMWISTQREAYKRSNLSEERTAQLESIPGWAWSTIEAFWETHFRLLKEYVEEHGNADVRRRGKWKGVKLGTWIGTQRTRHRRGTLPEEKIAQLESVPGWAWNIIEAAWNRNFRLLKEYVEEHGNAEVRKGDKWKSVKLGTWVRTQREAYKRSNLSEERTAQLESVPGWAWSLVGNTKRHNQ